MKNKKTFSISGKSQLDGFTKYRNTSILFCILVILVFFLFFRSIGKENIYMEPQADALYLSSRTGEEIYISYDSISSINLVNTFDFGFPKEGADDKQIDQKTGYYIGQQGGKRPSGWRVILRRLIGGSVF